MSNALDHLAGLGAIRAWLGALLPSLREGGSLAPRAIVLAGLSGTGRHSVARAFSATIGRPLLPFTHLGATDPASIFLVEDFGREHLPLPPAHRPGGNDAFRHRLTERPWELPAGLPRADMIEAVWHLDLPDVKERGAI